MLTIGTVAQRTKVGIAVLRAWEHRYGFPQPTRAASGHRRYSEHDVEQIQQVMRERGTGLSLEAAIDRVQRTNGEPEPSIFAGVRRRRPDITPHVLSKSAMLAISQAIEDEAIAAAERPVLLAAFQRERFYRASEDRYRDLARTAAATVVFADFPRNRTPEDGPSEVALDRDAPFLREWAVVCDAPGAGACLAGWERPGQQHMADDRRVFEAVWSVDPTVVRTAAQIGLGIARRQEPGLAGLSDQLGDHLLGDLTTALGNATALTSRIVAYLQDPPARGR